MTDDRHYGPAMAALTDLQRKYVLAMATNPFATPTEWARVAGYSQHSAGSRKAGHDCSHNPKIEAAVFEVAQSILQTEGPMLAAAGLLVIARDKSHPKHLRALETLANRVGLHETTEHTVKVEHRDLTGDAMLSRIKALAAKHGMDPERLIGSNVVSHETLVIEHERLQDGRAGEPAGAERGAELLQEGRTDHSGAGQPDSG